MSKVHQMHLKEQVSKFVSVEKKGAHLYTIPPKTFSMSSEVSLPMSVLKATIELSRGGKR